MQIIFKDTFLFKLKIERDACGCAERGSEKNTHLKKTSFCKILLTIGSIRI